MLGEDRGKVFEHQDVLAIFRQFNQEGLILLVRLLLSRLNESTNQRVRCDLT